MNPAHRQHPVCVLSIRVTAGLLLAFRSGSSPAWAEDLWAPDVRWTPAAAPTTLPWRAQLGVSHRLGYVPPFRAGDRSRTALALDAAAQLGPLVTLRLGADALRDDTAAAEPVIGPGDLRLGTLVHAEAAPGLHLGLGWEAKLPNAADGGEIGTDETDVTFGAGASWRRGPFAATASAGLAILGNPLRFAAQDDVPLLRLAGLWRGGAVALGPTFAADVGTSRNPARVRAGGVVEAGRRLHVRLDGAAGLTPAEADLALGLAVGWRSALPVR